MQKSTVIFCLFTITPLLALALVMSQIGHTPWGLAGAAGLVAVLTAQQLLRKPKACLSNPLKASGGVA